MTTLFLTNIDAPYRSEFYQTVSEKLSNDFILLTCAENESDRQWEIEKKITYKRHKLAGLNIKINTFGIRKYVYINFSIINYIRDPSTTRIVIGDASITSYLSLLLCALYKKKSFVWCEQCFTSPKKNLGDHIKSIFYRYAEAILVPSALSSKYISDQLKLKNKIVKINNAVPKSKINTIDKTVENSDSQLKLIYVGQFVQRKRIDLVFEIATTYAANHDVSLTLIGGEFADLHHIVDSVPNNLNLTVFPFMSRSEVDRHLHKSDCLLLVSDYEPWGMVVNEALSLNTKCILSENVGASDELDDGETCFTIKSNLKNLPTFTVLKTLTARNKKLISINEMAEFFVRALD